MTKNLTITEHTKKCEEILRSYAAHGKLPTAHIDGESYTPAQYMDACKRVYNYIKKNNELPPMVWWYNTPPPPIPQPTGDGWTLTGLFKQDYQDTSYTCGPSSAQMVFSALGLTFNEQQIASLARTNTSGTSHTQLYTAMRKLYSKLDIAEYYLSDIGFNGIIKKLKNNCEIILHIQTYPALSKDADGNKVWTHNYGHYIFLIGINPKTQRVRVADPTKGVKEFTYTQITNAINQVSGQKSVMVFYKP